MKIKNLTYPVLLIILLLTGIFPTNAGTTCNPLDFDLAPQFQAGPSVLSSAMADFNGDGKIDVATANADRGFSIIFGDGAGGFGPPKAYLMETDPGRITAADLNGDGKSDVVIAGAQNRFDIFLNSGTGTFGASTTFIPPAPGSGEFQQMVSGDFNGDGKIDIVYTQYQSGRKLRFLLGNGQGGLTLAHTLDLVGNESALEVGNLNGDAMADLLVSATNQSGLRNIQYVLGTTSGVFDLVRVFDGLIDKPIAFTIADFNNDTTNDFAVVFQNYNTEHFIRPYLNIAGAFTAQNKINLTYMLDPFDLTSGDYNGDGKQDIAAMIGAGLVVTEYGMGDGAFQNELLWNVPQGNFIHTTDANLDGKADLISIQGRSSNTNYISVLTNTNFTGFTAPKPIFYGEKMITAGDLNNDDLLDVITANETEFVGNSYIAYALNDGARSFLPAHTVDNGPNGLQVLRTGDFNGDGKLDVVSAHEDNSRMIEVYLGNGSGTLATGIPTSLNIVSNDAVVGDFNADGKDDLFVASESGQGYSLLATGTGTFTIAPNFPITLSTEGFGVNLQKGDFNSDGKIDIVANGTFNSNGKVDIYAGAGNGQFSLLAANVAPLMKAIVGDFNGDGKLDLAGFASGIFPANGIAGVLGDGAGGFGQPFTRTITGFEIRSLISGDFNDDGRDDVAYALGLGDGTGLTILLSDANGTVPAWRAPVDYTVGANPSNITAADFDNDGKTDIGYTNGISRGVFHNLSGAKPCISVSDTSVTEGDTGTTNASFTVNLSAASAQTVRVNYTLEMQTATLDADLQNVQGRLDIPAGQTTATITVPIAGDLLDEFDETFKVNLSSPAGASLVTTSALGTIIDNDAEPTLTISDVSRSESASGSAQFTVNLSAPSGKVVGFRFTTADGTAVAERDYAPANNLWTIAPGATTLNFGVFIFNENIYELDETYFLNITEPSNVTITDGQALGTIVNDDSVPTLNFSGGGIAEGDTGSNSITHSFFLSNPTYLPVTINYASVNGTAIAGLDYVALNGSVVIPAEQQSGGMTVQSIGDTINEPNESFTINLSVTNVASQPSPVTFTVFDDERVSNDYDLDGKTDIVVFRPSDRVWYTLFSSNGTFSAIQHGLSTDIPVAGDYNGDGRFDIAVWRPSVGTWFPRVTGRTQVWGQEGDIPVQGDYDNDGRIDFAVFRPSDHTWYIQLSSNNSYKFVSFGLAEDKPVQADYDGDGKTDIAVFRPSTGSWYILRSSDDGFVAFNFGLGTDRPVPGDYDGDGKADIAVFRDGHWYVTQSSDSLYTGFHWGQAGDKPVPGNYDGDAKTDYAVYRDGTWWIFRSSTNDFISTAFGLPDDIPIPFVSN